ncbi:hypothetical protein V9T40_002301 [Parthenolecanium corni]|uniref:BTB domain-containing protein n=1 Tax=Parthenolecanium corni TaxID=536013 RepID=A0AAN9Y5H0_9HEMI
MFNGGLPETQSPIKIVDVQPEAFKSMLEYIYADDINMDSLDQACELCYVAKKYMLPQLLKTCMEFIWKDVDCETALRAYEFAKLFDDSGILEKSMKIISEKTTDIVSRGSALSMNEKTLLDILDREELNVPSELYLFRVLQSWVLFNVNRTEDETYDVEKVRTFAKSALKKIRFLTMSVSEFAEVPAQSQLLTKDESFAILLNISSTQTKYPMPEGFCTSRIPRINPSHKIVCLAKRIQVKRPIKNPTVQINCGNLKDTLRFIANDNLTLLGIKIRTQRIHISIDTASEESSLYVRDPLIDRENGASASNANSNETTKSVYREFLIMYVKEIRNPSNSWFTHFTSLVEHDSSADIMFTTPAVIIRGHEYELGVTLSKDGYYPVGLFDRLIEQFSEDGVQFILSGNTTTAFIQSLIFTH